MSSIDLVILGMVLERPQSAYDLQKDVEYHHLSRWTKISVPSVYKKVLQLKEQGYLQSKSVKGNKAADKAIYEITDAGRDYFAQLMEHYATQQISFLFDFNVVITNLNKVEKPQALELITKLRESIAASARLSGEHARENSAIPLVGRTIFNQQRMLYGALSQWLDTFEAGFKAGD